MEEKPTAWEAIFEERGHVFTDPHPDIPAVAQHLKDEGLNRALDTFVKQALYHNLDLEMRNLPQATHGFDIFEETAAAQETIQRGIDFVKYQLSAVS